MNITHTNMIIANGVIEGKKLQIKFIEKHSQLNGLNYDPVVTVEGICEGTFHVIDNVIIPSIADEDTMFDMVCNKLVEMIQNEGFGSDEKMRGFIRWTYMVLGDFRIHGVSDGRVYCHHCDDVIVEYDEHTHYSCMTS